MLEQRSVVIKKTVKDCENEIDQDEPVYLITWSPDPSELPDTDFYLQHNMNVNLLSSYLQCCKSGLFCVESTQRGNPHYHGWYQTDKSKELQRIAIVKTMQRFGPQLKICKANKYRINSYKERGNALYYYKKDALTFDVEPNPITRDSKTTVDYHKLELASFLTNSSAKAKDIGMVLSNQQFYRGFYTDTTGTINY